MEKVYMTRTLSEISDCIVRYVLEAVCLLERIKKLVALQIFYKNLRAEDSAIRYMQVILHLGTRIKL